MPALKLFTSRQGTTLYDLSLTLSRLSADIERLPRDINWPEDFEPVSKYSDLRQEIQPRWPELGLYNDVDGSEFSENVPELIGDAIDDLSDIALDLTKTIEIAAVSAVGALSQLRFWYDIHLMWHSEDLQKHLKWKTSSTTE